jgi:hypothetical protein
MGFVEAVWNSTVTKLSRPGEGELDSDLEKPISLPLWRFLIEIERKNRDDELIGRGV